MPMNAAHGSAVISREDPFDVSVITSAALPWRTGPAVIGLWHAGGLAGQGQRVALVFPWLNAASQRRLWARERFASPAEQGQWMAEEAVRLGCPGVPEFVHYRGWYSTTLRSIIPCEDVFRAAPESRVVVLEEPEHLCWYPFTRRRARVSAKHVLGILMTNYPYYVKHSGRPGATILSWLIEHYFGYLVRAHTDRAVPIAPILPVRGVRNFVRDARIIGALPAFSGIAPVRAGTTGVYFLGRLVWEKGLKTLIDIAKRMDLSIDILGDGPDRVAIQKYARDVSAPARFLGATESPWASLGDYRVFFNPSLSETLCMTNIEALVAGRHVVLPDCPAFSLYKSYPNVHFYQDEAGACAALRAALATLPVPPVDARADFSWPAACERLAALWQGPDAASA